MKIDERRVYEIRPREGGEAIRERPVAYWMSRDQRADDNWALLHAQQLALESGSPLCVLFCLADGFLGATMRHYSFMLGGLERVEQALKKKNIPFFLLHGEPAERIPAFIGENRVAALVTDFDPLRVKRDWKRGVAGGIDIPFCEVDAHNIVPCRIASQKTEFAARTIRPKINGLLPEFLTEFPKLKKHPHAWRGRSPAIDWRKTLEGLDADTSVGAVDWIEPGEKAAARALRDFASGRIADYDRLRNDPSEDALSGLSPWLHFGHIAPQRAALAVRDSGAPQDAVDSFLEELIVRRELADNFCFYCNGYDSFGGFHDWAKKTLDEHRGDKREYLYTREQFEAARTHDPLWNAAQLQMTGTGRMHGFMRMYWGKKILEWTGSPEEALETAICLNDRYELDGRDPNGYTGAAWCIGGVHDRAWAERPVFGKIRYMNYNGCKRKFDVLRYIDTWAGRTETD